MTRSKIPAVRANPPPPPCTTLSLLPLLLAISLVHRLRTAGLLHRASRHTKFGILLTRSFVLQLCPGRIMWPTPPPHTHSHLLLPRWRLVYHLHTYPIRSRRRHFRHFRVFIRARVVSAFLPSRTAPLTCLDSVLSATSDTTLSFSLHPALKLNNIQFNIMVEPPIPQFHPALGAVDLRMHATSLPVLQIFIKIAELPFTFVVQNMDGVRIQDVLQTIRRELLSGVSYSELCYVPDQAQRAANQLSRLRHLQNPGRQGGILRVDCLGSRTNFVGLNRDPSTKGTWVADFTC